MMIYGYIPKSKKRKVPKVVQQRHEEWLKSISQIPRICNKSISKTVIKTLPFPKIPAGRETPQCLSIDTGFIPCTKKTQHSYTGEKMRGVATMHKSNAVPVFTDNEAKEISSMRR
jgi:hypothetical protein